MPNEFRIGRSTGYTVVTLVLHIGAAALLAIPLAHIAPVLTPVAMIVIGIALWRDLRCVAWRDTPDAVVALEFRAQCWLPHHRDGRTRDCMVLETFRASAAGVLLVLRDERGARERIVVPCDALATDDLRRLRVHVHAARAGSRV